MSNVEEAIYAACDVARLKKEFPCHSFYLQPKHHPEYKGVMVKIWMNHWLGFPGVGRDLWIADEELPRGRQSNRLADAIRDRVYGAVASVYPIIAGVRLDRLQRHGPSIGSVSQTGLCQEDYWRGQILGEGWGRIGYDRHRNLAMHAGGW